MYIDGEARASIDYPLFLAHGAGPAQKDLTAYGKPLDPWASANFGRTHDSGWYNTYLVPFGKSIRWEPPFQPRMNLLEDAGGYVKLKKMEAIAITYSAAGWGCAKSTPYECC